MKIKIIQCGDNQNYYTVAQCDSTDVATRIMQALWPEIRSGGKGSIQAWTTKRGHIKDFIQGFTESGAPMHRGIGYAPLLPKAK